MPYGIAFSRFQNGESLEIPSAHPREVFRSFGIEEHGAPAYVELPDGLSIDCLTSSLLKETTTGFMIEFRGISASLFELVYALCAECKLIAVIIDNPNIPIVCDRALAPDVPESLAAEHEPVFCASKEEIAQQICPGFDRWAEWVSRRTSHPDR